MAASASLTVEAPAKLNLYLEVLGRRTDGYHEIVTVLQTIDLCDSLTVALRERRRDVPPGVPDVSLAVDGDDDGSPGRPPLPRGADNLVCRAAAAVLQRAGATGATGVSIHLVKRIPVGGGLGGGSSDAAAAASATDRLLGSPCGAHGLHAVCAALGSDVPFFLHGGTALATGRGERVRPVDPPRPFDGLLIVPDFGVPTPAVYAALGAGPYTPGRRPADDDRALADAVRDADPAALEELFQNDLSAPACRVAPALLPLLAPQHRHLSGSGSTVFTFGADEPSDAAGLAHKSIRFVGAGSKNR